MNKSEHERLMQKYLEGRTTRSEEKSLFEEADSHGEEFQTWVQFVQHKRQEAPAGLSEVLWQDSPLKRDGRRKRLTWWSAAACVLLLLAVGVPRLMTSDSNEAEDSATSITLEEALAWIEETQPAEAPKEVFYQDEVITIYVTYD
ncbi:MAG: hypothetical protein KTR24_06655 [Saprospiraceae bacterium]|nr:hypothetical protein [Saprospiraceae bacterium]